MFGLFKKKTEIEKLSEQYAKLMKEAHTLWQTNRVAGDKKMEEAEQINKQIEALQQK